MENLATFASIGAVGGLAASVGLGLISSAKRIFNYKKQKIENEKYLKLDSDKYKEEDQKELELINEKIKEPKNEIEVMILDIALGSFKDENIRLEQIPTSIEQLNKMIDNMNREDKKKSKEIMSRISDNLDNPDFIKNLQKAGKISVGLFTAGLAALSIYDIAKGGTFLPELSMQLFPKNNIHAPVDIPPSIDTKLDPTDKNIINKVENTYNEVTSDNYMIENNDEALIEYGLNFAEENPGLAGLGAQQAINDAATTPDFIESAVDWVAKLFGAETPPNMIPDIPKISAKLNSLSTKELYEFYRYFNNIKDDGSEMYSAVREALSYNAPLEKVTNYINGYINTQKTHDLVNDLCNKVAVGLIPLSTALETIGVVEKQNTTSDYIDENTIKSK